MIKDKYIVFIQNMKNYEIIGFYTINDDLKLYKSMHSGNYWCTVVDLKNANIRITLDLKKIYIEEPDRKRDYDINPDIAEFIYYNFN